MLKKLRLLIWLSILSLILVSVVWAQRGPGPKGRMYNPQTEETFRAEVLKLETFTLPRGRHTGIHLVVKTDKGTIPVHLGPSFFVEKQSITFAPQDKVEITGSRINPPRGPVIIAREVKKGDKVLKLRNADGIPVWRGMGFRRQGRVKLPAR
jgi:hypothetical protein